jgi:hypothetical protein
MLFALTIFFNNVPLWDGATPTEGSEGTPNRAVGAVCTGAALLCTALAA